jgi:hypothetical protein
MFGLSHLIASVSGFLSLMAGATIITLFEIFYFFFVKILCKTTTSVESVSRNQRSQNIFSELLRNYSESSTVHGLSLLSEGKLFWFVGFLCECLKIHFAFFRVIYAAVLVFSAAFCVQTIRDVFESTDRNPILYRIDEKMWKTSEVRRYPRFFTVH